MKTQHQSIVAAVERMMKLVVLDGAPLVGVGTHDELMPRNGLYSELYRIQAAAFR